MPQRNIRYLVFDTESVVEKQADGSIRRKNVAPVAFVPMTGEAQAE